MSDPTPRRLPSVSSMCVNHPARQGKYRVPGLVYCGACRLEYVTVKRALDEARREWQVKRAFCIWGHTLDKANAFYHGGGSYCWACITEDRPGWTTVYRSDQVMPEAYPERATSPKTPHGRPLLTERQLESMIDPEGEAAFLANEEARLASEEEAEY